MPFLLLKNNSIYKDDNSFTITMENSQVHANTVYQFNFNSKDEIADLWEKVSPKKILYSVLNKVFPNSFFSPKKILESAVSKAIAALH
jgi:hypothetical protein